MDTKALQTAIAGVLHEASPSTLSEYADEIANSPGLAGAIGGGIGALGGLALGGDHKLRNAAIGATALGGTAAVAASPDARATVSQGLETLVNLIRGIKPNQPGVDAEDPGLGAGSTTVPVSSEYPSGGIPAPDTQNNSTLARDLKSDDVSLRF